MENCQDEIFEWLHENYPQYLENISNAYLIWHRLEHYLVPIFDHEWTKASATIHSAAKRIWNELKDVDGVFLTFRCLDLFYLN